MIANPHQPASTRCIPFSLFDGDLLNRAFGLLGLQSRRAWHLAGRSAVVIGLTWVPMAGFALEQGLYSRHIEARNFFADYAAYAQFLIALPLFIVAERVVARNTREAARHFLDTGVVGADDMAAVDASHREVERLRLWWATEAVCVALAYVFAIATLAPEFLGKSLVTWHTDSASHWPTLPGLWAVAVALPLLNYWWLRLACKVLIWTRYLYRMSRLHLVLVASHPDLTGGIGFISDVQAKFALMIFAYGISNVAAVIAYKIAIEGASPWLAAVWGPAVGFAIGAPVLFTGPLLMFTKQLYRTKHRALTIYREQAMRQALEFESHWLAPDGAAQADRELSRLNNVATIFARVEDMRVVPFDLRSAVQLTASTVGSIATALPLLKIEGPLTKWLEFVSSLLKK